MGTGLDDFVADQLRQQAPDLSAAWIELVKQTPDAAAGGDTLVADLRDQVPALVGCIVEFMREPSESTRAEVVQHLKSHADRRHARGYNVQQLLTDFELLSGLMFKAFTDAVAAFDRADAREVATLANRLREGLMSITSDAVGMYRDAELEQRQSLARKISRFARAMTHELKNPLGAATSGTQMLQDSDVVKTADDRDRFLRLVLRNLLRMQDLIHDISALALVDGTAGMERWTRLDAVVAKVFDELRPLAQRKGVALVVEGTLPDPPVDATRLEIALINLVGNAIKYSDPAKPDRSVTIRAEHTVGTRRLPWRVEVSDNGLGIPIELHGSVFKVHFRAHPEVAEGTGLGLTIASELIAGAGGRLTFRSEPSKGTTFIVEIPEGGVRTDDRRTKRRRSPIRA